MKIYVDFDGVILDTWKYLSLEFENINTLSKEARTKYIENLNWNKILRESSEINNSIELLKRLRTELAILTKVNSLNNEAIAKIKYLRSKGIKNEIIVCPYNLNKSDIVPPVGNLLIDDSIHILDDWKSKGGIPIFFSKDNSNYDEWGNENNGYAKINSLENLTQEKILLYRFLMK